MRSVDTHGRRHVGERAVAVVVEKLRRGTVVIDEQIRIAVIVIIEPGRSFAARSLAFALDSRAGCHFLEGSVAAVAVQAIRTGLVANEHVEKTIVVKVSPGGADRIDRVHQAGRAGDIGKRAVAVVAQ